jgi:CelD/BcsL family acetyltransferase involved in cellulose biosynthesis
MPRVDNARINAPSTSAATGETGGTASSYPDNAAIEIGKAPAPPLLMPMWRDLERRADGSFYQSWEWIGTWLETQAEAPWLISARGQDGRVLALGLLCMKRRTWLGSASLYLHATGDPVLDRIYVEYNGLLKDRTASPGLEEACLQALSGDEGRRAGLHWTALYFPGVDSAFAQAAIRCGLSTEIDRKRSGRIDLRAIAAAEDVVSTFGYNARQQVRRSHRHYERIGPLRVEAAPDLETTLRWLGELQVLQHRRFGERSAFSAPAFCTFHRRLVERALPQGRVEILRVSAGEQAIGYLYDFLHRGWAGNYSSGVDYYDVPKQVKPGLLCFALAAERWRLRGGEVYDFMAGEQRYKWNLGSSGPELLWIRARRQGVRSFVEDVARSGGRMLRRTWRASFGAQSRAGARRPASGLRSGADEASCSASIHDKSRHTSREKQASL